MGRTGRVMRGVKREDKNMPPPRIPIAPGIVIPNQSGDHSKGRTGTPVNDLDIANKKYVDDNAMGSLTSAYLYVGNASNVPTGVAITGDVNFTNAGVTTVTDLTITNEATGDVLYFNGSNWIRLAVGSNGEVLTLASGVPTWAAASGGSSFKSGQYTGDGSTSQAITGIGFAVKFVMIWKDQQTDLSNLHIFQMSDQMTSDWAIAHWGNGTHQTVDDRIISVDADGFTVDDNGNDSDPNKNGVTYNYVAWG